MRQDVFNRVSFRKSNRSEPNLNCVEIGHTDTVFAVRDSKVKPSPVLVVAPDRGLALLRVVKTGRFDL